MDITKLKEAGWLYVVDNPGDIEVQMLRLIRTSIYLDTNITVSYTHLTLPTNREV